MLSKSEYVYKIINSYGSIFNSYNDDILKFGNINTDKNLNLKSIDRSELLFGNNFDDESININLFKSEKSFHYNFLMSNVISKLLSSS